MDRYIDRYCTKSYLLQGFWREGWVPNKTLHKLGRTNPLRMLSIRIHSGSDRYVYIGIATDTYMIYMCIYIYTHTHTHIHIYIHIGAAEFLPLDADGVPVPSDWLSLVLAPVTP